MEQTKQIKDGEEVFIRINEEDEMTICCDCNLTHQVHYRYVDSDTLGITVWVDKEATEVYRNE